jgi:1,4-alpha-glucan branching enzyme
MKKDQSAHSSKPKGKRAQPKAKCEQADRPCDQPKKSQEETRKIDRLMRLMTQQKGKALQFEIAAKEDSKVYVAGTFNNWDPTTHPLDHHPEDGVFRGTINLPEGTHEYKFVVDGVWHLDTKCPNFVPNAHGTLNSVIQV